MKKSLLVSSLFIAGLLTLGRGAANADGFVKGRRMHTNPTGGVTGNFAAGMKGPNGGMAGRIHGFATDGQGNTAGGGAAAFKTPEGAKGVHAGMTTRSAEGAVHHQSGGAVSGTNGSASSSGGFTKTADGMVSGSRSTSVQSKNSEASYQGNITYSASGGVHHAATCTDTEGDMVTCSGQK
jgi:hypothetical protein